MLAAITGRKGLNIEQPPHDDTSDDEVYCVLDGQLTCYAGSRQLTVSAGSLAYLPRDVRHSFRIDTEHVCFLLLTMPQDFGGWLPVPSIPPISVALSPAEVTRLNPLALAAFGAQYGFEPGAPAHQT
jgi:hypothetical protein